MKSFNSMVPTALEYQWGPLMIIYMSFMSHNKGVVTNLIGELISKFDNSPQMMMKRWFESHPACGKTISNSNFVPYIWIMCPFHGEA